MGTPRYSGGRSEGGAELAVLGAVPERSARRVGSLASRSRCDGATLAGSKDPAGVTQLRRSMHTFGDRLVGSPGAARIGIVLMESKAILL